MKTENPIGEFDPPRKPKRKWENPPKDKHERYRRKNLRQGRCPHCGKPCAPYSECEHRRIYKRLNHILNKMVDDGILYKVGGKYKKTGMVKSG